jgi:hypothetical protein
MSVEIIDASKGVLMIKISGKLRHSELAAAQKNAAEMLEKRGDSSLLVLAENFEGWERAMTGEIFRGSSSSMRN